MIGALKRAWENFRGVGEAAVTVPPMDGALRSNRLIEEAAAVVSVPAPDDIVVSRDRVLVSAGNSVLRLDRGAGRLEPVKTFDAAVTALAAAPDGAVAVGLEDGHVMIVGGRHDGRVIDSVGGRPLVCPTALLFAGPDELLVAQGSATRRPSQWKHDLMQRCATGAVWRLPLADGEAKCLAANLAWPYGLALAGNGAVAVSESWKHRIMMIAPDGGVSPVLADLPGYPARIAPAAGGGYWLSIFAPRNQLIEFIQREPEFLKRMMDEIDPDYWAAPSLKPSGTFLVPLQGGAQKHLGMLKPWAPSFSYGLVVRLDRQFRPVSSLHSRADGLRHGVTGCAVLGSELLIASKGGDVVVAAALGSEPQRKRVLEGVA